MVKRRKSDSDSSSSSNEDEDWQENGRSRSKATKKIKKPIKIKEEEREEGEVEDDEESNSEEFNDGYDENLMGDEEDQMRLAKMNEKERELELFNRSEKREVLKTRFEIERKLRMAKKKEQMQSQTKMRSNERRRNMEEKRKVKNAIKGLKEQREKRKQKQQRLRAIDVYSSSSDDDEEDADDKKTRRKSSSSSSSSYSSSDESDNEKSHKRDDDESKRLDEREDRESDDEKEKDGFILTCAELNSIRISRNLIEEWCHAPFFKDTILGSFVKIGIGMRLNSEHKHIQVYRVTQVVDVTEGPKAYNLGKTRTNKVVKLKHGIDAKSFRLEFVSNSDFTESEFLEWKARLEKDRVEMITKDFVEKKKRDIEKAKNYNYKDSDIDAIVREKEKYKSMPVNFAVKKTELLKQKEMAEQLNDQDEVERISQLIEELEEKAKEIDLKRTQNISAISYINEKNRMRNILEAEKAIIEARLKDKEQIDDPFRRRKCAPMLVHKFSKTSDALKERDNKNANKGKDAVDSAKKDENSSKGSSPKHTMNSNNDLFSAHNFDIQIDFDGLDMNNSNVANHSSSSFSSLGYSHASPSLSKITAPNRRSLNLEEYKKKKGLI